MILQHSAWSRMNDQATDALSQAAMPVAEPDGQSKKATGFQRSLKGRALRLLSQREHSRFELERKLKPFEETPGELARALDELAAKDFINEQRVVESVVHTRSRKLGASRVRQELQAKGLPAEAIQEAVQEMRSTELARARALSSSSLPSKTSVITEALASKYTWCGRPAA